MTWTEAKVCVITQMWADGYSSSVIAERVGKSRNAVIGKLGRIGLIGDPDKNRARAVERAQANKKRREARQRVSAPLAVQAPESPPPPVPVNPEGVSLADLTNTTCRWPLHTDLPARFCGAHAPHGPYCAEHTRKAVNPARGGMA